MNDKDVKQSLEDGRYQGWSKLIERLTWTNCSSE